MDWSDICSFPLGSKCTSSQRILKYQCKWMSDSVSTKLNHPSRDIIMTMCLIYTIAFIILITPWIHFRLLSECVPLSHVIYINNQIINNTNYTNLYDLCITQVLQLYTFIYIDVTYILIGYEWLLVLR